jgi:hypothetical protein
MQRMRMIKFSLAFIIVIVQFGCSNSQLNNPPFEKNTPTKRVYTSHNNDAESNNTCGFNDDTYSATVDYDNPTTGYNTTYTLDVEVEDCQVVQIDFPNGGYLNDDHITPEDLDNNGDATIEDDRGRTFQVHIDKIGNDKIDDNKNDNDDSQSGDNDN